MYLLLSSPLENNGAAKDDELPPGSPGPRYTTVLLLWAWSMYREAASNDLKFIIIIIKK